LLEKPTQSFPIIRYLDLFFVQINIETFIRKFKGDRETATKRDKIRRVSPI
jgi:hypothetical protein